MIPTYLELSPMEEELFFSLIIKNICDVLISEIRDFVIEKNEQYISEISAKKEDQTKINHKINIIKNITEPLTKAYLEKWISLNSNYKLLLEEILSQETFLSLSNLKDLEQFMKQIVTLDTTIPQEHYKLLFNFDISPAQRLFQYLIIKMSDQIGSKFIEKQSFIADAIFKDILSKISLDYNKYFLQNKNIQKKWKLQWN
jgi:hypothetical protein